METSLYSIISAHISYAYAKSSGSSSEKAITALETLGWPVFLGAFTTIVGILVLTLVDAYIVQIFFKTIFLVIGFSLCHGLLFLPILLTLLLPDRKIHLQDKQDTKYLPKRSTPRMIQRVIDDSMSIDSKELEEVDLHEHMRKS